MTKLHRPLSPGRAFAGMFKIACVVILLSLTTIAVLNAISTIAIVAVSEWRRDTSIAALGQQLASLPNYRGREGEIRQHVLDARDLGARFAPLAGYRSAEYRTRTINVGADGRRFDPHAPALTGRPVAFYGGSTVWGADEIDSNTFPAIYARVNGVPVLNEGESGYTSRQELGWLINNFGKEYSPRIIVFYDGVNDISRCDPQPTRGMSLAAADVEKPAELLFDYRKLIPGVSSAAVSRSDYVAVLLGYVYPTALLMDKAVMRFGGQGNRIGIGADSADITRRFQCASKASVAEQAAKGVAALWHMAHDVAAARGAGFVAILQPNIYTGRARTDRIAKDALLGENYRAFYGAIRRQMASEHVPWFVDMTDALDDNSDEYLYADYCHLSVRGNELIAQKMTAVLDHQTSNTQ